MKINPKTGRKQYKSVLEMIWYIDISLKFKLLVTFQLLKARIIRFFKKDKSHG